MVSPLVFMVPPPPPSLSMAQLNAELKRVLTEHRPPRASQPQPAPSPEAPHHLVDLRA